VQGNFSSACRLKVQMNLTAALEGSSLRSAGVACLSLLPALALLALSPSATASYGVSTSKALTQEARRAARLDPTFGQAGRVTLPPQPAGGAIPVLMPDDSLVIGGRTLLRLAPDGQLDESFGAGGTLTPPAPPDGDFQVEGLAVDPHDRLIVAGTSELPAGEVKPSVAFGNGTPESPQAVRVVRYLPSGALDTSFGDHGIVETDFGLPPPVDESGQPLLPKPWVKATGVAVDGEGRVVLTGGSIVGLQFGCFHDWFFNTLTYAAFVARLTESGTPDASFGGGDGVFGGHSTDENPLHAEFSDGPLVGPDGSVTYAHGDGRCPRAEGSNGLARLTADGAPSTSFTAGSTVRRWITAAALAPNGSTTVVGPVTPWYFPKEPLRARVTRIGPQGKPDRSYGHRGQTVVTTPGGPGSSLHTLAMDGRGRALLGGTMISAKAFRGPAGSAKKRHRHFFVLVRLKANGRLDWAFGPRGRIATRFGALGVNQSSLLIDSQKRAVVVGSYGRTYTAHGLVVARYLIDRQ